MKLTSKVILLIMFFFISCTYYAIDGNKRRMYREMKSALKKPLNVKGLDLSGKRLENIPKDVFLFKNLEILKLNNNLIASISDSLFYELDNIKVVYLDDNRLTSLPSSVGELQKLEFFSCRNNNLKQLPYELRKVKSLKKFIAYDNYLDENQIDSLRKDLPNCKFITKITL